MQVILLYQADTYSQNRSICEFCLAPPLGKALRQYMGGGVVQFIQASQRVIKACHIGKGKQC